MPLAKELAKWQPVSLSMPFQWDECNHHGLVVQVMYTPSQVNVAFSSQR